MTQQIITSELESAISGLTRMQRAFVLAYASGKAAGPAAAEAGYSARTADQKASALLKDPQIANAVAVIKRQETARLYDEYAISREKVLRQVAIGAFPDVRRLFREDGSPKSIHELDYETSCMIAGIEVIEKYEGSGEDRVFVGNVIKYKLADRRGYVDMLMRHVGEYEIDNRQSGAAAANAITALVSQMRGSSLQVVKDVRDGAIDV